MCHLSMNGAAGHRGRVPDWEERSISPTAEARALLEGCCVAGAGSNCDTTCTHGAASPPSEWVVAPDDIPNRGPTSGRVKSDLDRLAGLPTVSGNAVRILSDGADSFGAMLESIRNAKSDVRLENFIFRADTVGRVFARELRSKADQGLRVRVLHDPAGAIIARRPPADLLFRGSRAEVGLFNLGLPTARRRSIGRDHRKLVVVDGNQMIAGGICLADAWAGNCIRHCTWRDSAVHVRGPAAAMAGEAFEDSWRHSWRKHPLAPASGSDVNRESPTSSGCVPVRILANLADDRPTLRVLERVIAAAERRILISNPYVVPPRRIVHQLERAAMRGVDVRLLIPGRNNHRLVGLSVEHGLGALLQAGCRVFLWQGAMLHAKTIVVDDAWSLVGSTNLDTLSLHKNAELDVEIHGTATATQMSDLFDADCEASTPMTLDAWRNRGRVRRIAGALAHRLRRWQ